MEVTNPEIRGRFSIPLARKHIQILVELYPRVEAKSRWCEREDHDAEAYQVGNRYFKICPKCLESVLEKENNIEVEKIGRLNA